MIRPKKIGNFTIQFRLDLCRVCIEDNLLNLEFRFTRAILVDIQAVRLGKKRFGKYRKLLTINRRRLNCICWQAEEDQVTES